MEKATVKYKIGNTEFVKDPEAFIQFLRSEEDALAGFGKGALVAAGSEVITTLIKLMTNEQEPNKIRRRAGHALSLVGSPAIRPLMDLLEAQRLNSQSSSEIIGMAASALGGIGAPALEPLILALGAPQKAVRFGAAIALMQTGEAKAMEALSKAANKAGPEDSAMFKMVMG